MYVLKYIGYLDYNLGNLYCKVFFWNIYDYVNFVFSMGKKYYKFVVKCMVKISSILYIYGKWMLWYWFFYREN